MKLFIHRTWPIALGLLVTALFAYAQAEGWIVPDLTTALSALTTVGAIAIGFLATAKSILISIKDTKPVLRGLQTNVELYGQLIGNIREAIHWCFLSVALSTVAMLISKTPSPTIHKWLILFVVLFGAIAGGACFRITRTFFKILSTED